MGSTVTLMALNVFKETVVGLEQGRLWCETCPCQSLAGHVTRKGFLSNFEPRGPRLSSGMVMIARDTLSSIVCFPSSPIGMQAAASSSKKSTLDLNFPFRRFLHLLLSSV